MEAARANAYRPVHLDLTPVTGEGDKTSTLTELFGTLKKKADEVYKVLDATFSTEKYQGVKPKVEFIFKVAVLSLCGLAAATWTFLTIAIISGGVTAVANDKIQPIIDQFKKAWLASGLTDSSFQLAHLPLYGLMPFITTIGIAAEVGYYLGTSLQVPAGQSR